MSTPSPWDLRPLGDPVFRRRGTFQKRLRFPTHVLENGITSHRPPAGAYYGRNLTRSCRWRRCTGVLPTSVRFRYWTLGFRQSSFSHIAQALRGRNRTRLLVLPALRSCSCPHPPFGFRLAVHLGVICPELRPTSVGNSLGAYHGAQFLRIRLSIANFSRIRDALQPPTSVCRIALAYPSFRSGWP
jgi:hypothetical protein